MFLYVRSRSLVEKLNKLHEEEFGKKYDAPSDKPHAALYNFTVTFRSHMKWISGFILHTVYLSDHFAFFSW
jgi:hypothetical protein